MTKGKTLPFNIMLYRKTTSYATIFSIGKTSID